MRQNPGHLPDEAKGRRVIVRLRDGSVHGREPNGTTGKLGWDAGTTRWTLTGAFHDVAEFEVV